MDVNTAVEVARLRKRLDEQQKTIDQLRKAVKAILYEKQLDHIYRVD